MIGTTLRAADATADGTVIGEYVRAVVAAEIQAFGVDTTYRTAPIGAVDATTKRIGSSLFQESLEDFFQG